MGTWGYLLTSVCLKIFHNKKFLKVDKNRSNIIQDDQVLNLDHFPNQHTSYRATMWQVEGTFPHMGWEG